jgi:hypothetical protein
MPLIIPADSPARFTGGVFQFSEALERYPDAASIVLYYRVSSWGQAGKGETKLEDKTHAVIIEVLRLARDKLRRIVRAVEEGKLSKPRRKLLAAIEYARAYQKASRSRVILVTGDLSRFIRAESYHRVKNREARPTPEEFAKLRAMAGGVILATLADPAMTESERHSRATRATGRCGRPPDPVDHKLNLRILATLGRPFASSITGSLQWGEDTSLSKVAKQFNVAKSKVQRLVDGRVPRELVEGRTREDGGPMRWKDLMDPYEAYLDAYERGSLTVPEP